MIMGADISTLQQVEDRGLTFSDERGVRPLERILADHGVTHIRLRLWVDPPYPYSDLPHVLAMARRIKAAGLKFLLDFHYADFWADPGKQPTPARWQDQDLPTLAQTVHDYTAATLQAFAQQGTPPDMVQIGNEITAGMLWPQGKLYVDTGTQRWDEFTTLLKAGIAGAHAGSPTDHMPRIMVHIDRGGDNAGSRYFFDRIRERGVTFDIIGLSFYPWWHGDESALRDNLQDLARHYDQDIIVVECAYPWTSEQLDEEASMVTGNTDLPPGYPATIDGQLRFLQNLRSIVEETPNHRGAGVMYWEPAWLPGVGWEPDAGNGWGNLALFDPTGRALPSLRWFQVSLPATADESGPSR